MKIAVLIPNKGIFQRFIISSAFKDLQEVHDLYYIFPERMAKGLHNEKTKIDKNNIIFFEEANKKRGEMWGLLFDASCFSVEYRGTPFQNRYLLRKNRILKPDPLPGFSFSFPYFKKFFRRLFGNFARKFYYSLYFKNIENEISKLGNSNFKGKIIKKLGLNLKFLQLLKRLEPGLIILPSSLTESITNDAIQASRELGIPSLLLQSGWDNLASKGLVPLPPGYMGVWGEQSRMHAARYQKIPEEKTVCLGAPHYESLKAKVDIGQFKKSLRLAPEDKVILFGGSLRQFDEISVLRTIDDLMEKGKLPLMKVIYRPHPWREIRSREGNFFDYKWRNIMLDKEILETYKIHKQKGKGISPESFLFSMEYLNGLYRSVDYVISPLSTLLLESMLVGKPVFAIAFSDGKHSYGVDYTAQMAHFAELRNKNAEGFVWCENSSEFEEKIKLFIKENTSFSPDGEISKILQRLVCFDNMTYSKKLKNLVEKISITGDCQDSQKMGWANKTFWTDK